MRLMLIAALSFACTGFPALAENEKANPPAPVTIFGEAEVGFQPTQNAETVKPGEKPVPPPDQWSAAEVQGASGGKVLGYPPRYSSPETDGQLITIPAAGRYRIWIRYYKKKPAAANLFTVIREADGGASLGFALFDWKKRTLSETPYSPAPTSNEDKIGFVWDSLELTFERPQRVTIGFGGSASAEHMIDCYVITTDTKLDPRALDADKLASLANADASAAPNLGRPAEGFVWSPGLPFKPDQYAGLADINKRFLAGLINCASIFVDGARMNRMGFNRDHTQQPYEKWGIKTMAPPMEGFNDPAFNKAHPTPEGRFVNAQGQVGNTFSIHYQPWIDASIESLKQKVKDALAADNGSYGWWRIASEEGGWMDYSPWAVDAFRKWLAEKHGNIETLNKRWGTTFKNFEEVTPAKTYEDSHPSWLEFREFSGHSYAVSVGRRIPIIQALDPQHRPCLGANSNLDIAVPYFMAFRPNDFEELIRVGLKNEKYVAFDIYCADDDMGSSIDFFNSLGQGRKLVNQEFSNHAVDPRIAARTYWVQVAKGIHGINLFMFQDTPNHATYPKWALTQSDGAPKQKLGAYSDAAQEVHRLEPMLMAANYTYGVKPVAMYWSRIDIGLDKPHDSWYGHSFNSPLHIYETLRGLGYPVRWITPRQIAEGELDQVSALVLSGCDHIPQAAAAKIEGWIKGGGAVIADSWPGAFDEYGQPQATLSPIFGVRPAPKKGAPKESSQIALQESKQGYGEVTDAASLREKYYEKIDEMAQFPGATHPVAVAMGDFMLAGYEPESIECVAGTMVGMSHRGKASAVVNEYGQGKSLYSAMLLGTIYEAAPTRYEWDSMHSGDSYGRLLDAFLKYAGAKPATVVTGLPRRVVAKLRIESPLVTPDGNALIGLISMNDTIVSPFELSCELPKGAGPFVKTYVVTGGSRLIQPVECRVIGTTMSVHIPAFDTHAMIVAIKDSGPLVSLDLKGVKRGPASLAVIQPGQTIEIEAVVHNPSPRALGAGKLTFAAPSGWQLSALELAVGPIPAGGEGRATLRIKAPDVAGICRLEPLLSHYESGEVKSTPATEMMWWGLRSVGE